MSWPAGRRILRRLCFWLGPWSDTSRYYGYIAAAALVNLIELSSMRQLVAWGGLFIGTLLLGAMANFMFAKVIDSTGLAGTDRTLGFVFGIFRGLLIVLAIVIILPKAVPVEQDLWWKQSALIPVFEGFESWGRQVVTDLKQLITHWI